MEYQELVGLYNRIVTGKTIILDRGHTFIVRDPSPLDKMMVEPYYKLAYDKLFKSKNLTEEEVQSILLERGLWNKEKDNELSKLEDFRKELQKELSGCDFQSAKKRRISSQIEFADFSIKQAKSIKNSLYKQTVEYQANVYKFKHLLFNLTFKPDGSKYWEDWELFSQEDESLINYLLQESYFVDIEEKSIRKLARSEPWRSIWIGSVKTGNLFDRPLTECTDYQRLLVSWSVLYDNVFESPDCPDNDIIDNDVLLDAWLVSQKEKRDERRTQKSANNLISDNPKIANAREVGIVVDSIEDAEKVYNLNDPVTKAKLRKRGAALKERGSLSEGNLPDVRLDHQMMFNEMNAKHPRN